MEEDIITVVNAWYRDYNRHILTDSVGIFELKLLILLPDYKFGFTGDDWILINKI
jgi:hypothetical protein